MDLSLFKYLCIILSKLKLSGKNWLLMRYEFAEIIYAKTEQTTILNILQEYLNIDIILKSWKCNIKTQ